MGGAVKSRRSVRLYRARAYVGGVPGAVGRVRAFTSQREAMAWCARQRAAGLCAEWWKLDRLAVTL